MPNIILSKKAEKEFNHLTFKDKKKIIRKIELLKNVPAAGKLLSGKLKGLRSLKAWPHRIIYELEKSNRIIVHKILHRQQAYK